MGEEAKIATQEFDQLNAFLKKVDDKYFLGKLNPKECRLDLSREELILMTAVEVDGYRWELAQYGVILQKNLNESTARYNWLDDKLNRLCEEGAPHEKGFKWEERKSLVINENEYAEKLIELKSKCKLVVDKLSFLMPRIDVLLKIASDVAYSKKKEQ